MEYARGLAADRLANRPWWEKAQDTFVKWRRGFLLSGPVTLAKLTSAAVQRMAFTPMEEVIGAEWSKVFPELARKAHREGGINSRAEARAITQAVTKGMTDAWDVLTTGQSELDVLYGGPKEGYIRESDVLPRSAIDFFGKVHGALKAPTKRAEFARSFEKRATAAIRDGIDVTDPMVQTRIAAEAYKDANRAIFLQDNMVVAAYKRALTAFEQKSKVTGNVKPGGKVAATVSQSLFPIVRVPTNIVAETFQYALGLPSGLSRLAIAKAFGKGVEGLKPEEADMIMRHLKKGSLGAAVLLLGYFNPNTIGGYYQSGGKRKASDVKAGNIQIYGHNIPSYLLHNPLLETLQFGATIRRVSDSKLRKKDKDTQGIPAGLAAGALGLVEAVPFVREQIEATKAFNPNERTDFFGELSKSFVVPQLLQWAATQTDKDAKGNPIQRKPGSILEYIESGLPGARQNLPVKKPKK
jgi:hypothetical protein